MCLLRPAAQARDIGEIAAMHAGAQLRQLRDISLRAPKANRFMAIGEQVGEQSGPDESGRQQEGNRPTRQLYEITADGRLALALLRRSGLSDIWFKFDPFNLAFAGIDAEGARNLPRTLEGRLESLQALLAESLRVNAESRAPVSAAKQWALKHTQYRMEAEVRFLADLLKAADEIKAHGLTVVKKKLR